MNAPAHSRRGDRGLALRLLAALVALMWVVQAINSLDHQALNSEGIRARVLSGLPGIVFAPFLHSGYGHLIANTVPFVVLGAVIALSGVARIAAVTAIVALVAGVGTWLTADSSAVTVGASGVVFGYATFLLTRGFFSRRLIELALGVVVLLLFGGALLWSLIPHAGVSWQDHLFGAVGGVLAARWLAPGRTRRSAAARLEASA